MASTLDSLDQYYPYVLCDFQSIKGEPVLRRIKPVVCSIPHDNDIRRPNLNCDCSHPRAHFGKGVYKNQATKMLSKHAVPVDKYKNLKVLSFQLDASQRSRVRWNMTET